MGESGVGPTPKKLSFVPSQTIILDEEFPGVLIPPGTFQTQTNRSFLEEGSIDIGLKLFLE